jgi:hypothetical protein
MLRFVYIGFICNVHTPGNQTGGLCLVQWTPRGITHLSPRHEVRSLLQQMITPLTCRNAPRAVGFVLHHCIVYTTVVLFVLVSEIIYSILTNSFPSQCLPSIFIQSIRRHFLFVLGTRNRKLRRSRNKWNFQILKLRNSWNLLTSEFFH